MIGAICNSIMEIVLTKTHSTDVCSSGWDFQPLDDAIHEIQDKLPVIDSAWIAAADTPRTVDDKCDVKPAICST